MTALGRRSGPGTAVVAAGLLVLAGGIPAGAQEPEDEAAVLRRAVSLESRGRYADARAALEELLERRPGSSAALFSLERVLRPLGEVGAVLPFADRFLDREPASSGARYLKLRVLSEVDSVAGIMPAVEDWIRAEPHSPEPYREGARVLEEREGRPAALALLRRGREALGSDAPLALELGDVLLRAGDQRAAMEAWGRAVGRDGREASAVLRRIEQLDAPGPGAVRPILDVLREGPSSPERLRVAARIAAEAGLGEEAVELAADAADVLEPAARRAFLLEMAAAAEEAEAHGVALWAYRALREGVGDGGGGGAREARALEQRIAEAALAAGDTAASLRARERLAGGLPPRSPERRRALADLIRVEAAGGDASGLVERLEAFREEFPDAPETDALASAVAAGLGARGMEDEAAGVLEGVRGPRSALERAWLLFEEGSLEEGRDALLASAGGLDPRAATGVIQLVALLDRLSPPGGVLAAGSAALAHRGAAEDGVEAVREGLGDVPEADRPPLLAHAARLADAGGLAAEAARLREGLLERYPDAPETAEATLDLARWRAREPEGVADAVRLLEGLILERPNSAVVPAARRELDRLRAGAGDGASRP